MLWQASGFGIDYEGPIDSATVQLDNVQPMHDKEQLSRILCDVEPDRDDVVACHSVV